MPINPNFCGVECDPADSVLFKDMFKRANFAAGIGSSGANLLVREAMRQQLMLDSGLDQLPCCDPGFRKSPHALNVTRHSTVFLCFANSLPLTGLGNWVYTPPTGNDGNLEFFKHGIPINAIGNANAATTLTGLTPLNLMPGENSPLNLGGAETDATQDVDQNSGSNADLVTGEDEDFILAGMSFEIGTPFSVDQTSLGVYRKNYNFAPFKTDTTEAERWSRAILDGTRTRMFMRRGADERTWLPGKPIMFPSPTGYFGSTRGITPGQAVPGQFTEFTSVVRTRMKPKLTSAERLRTFLDVPVGFSVERDPAAPAMATLSPTGTMEAPVYSGRIWVPMVCTFYGAMVCDSEIDDNCASDVVSEIALLRAQVNQLTNGNRPPSGRAR